MAEVVVLPQAATGSGLDPSELDPDDIALCLPDDVQLDPQAGKAIMNAFSLYPEAVAVYWDILVDGQRRARPAWSPTRVQSEPGACLPLAVRASWPPFDPAMGPRELEQRLAESDAVVVSHPSGAQHPPPTPRIRGGTPGR